MAEIRVKENETLDSALRRFKRQCVKSGVLTKKNGRFRGTIRFFLFLREFSVRIFRRLRAYCI